jgi:hypothetical protein
MMNCADKFLKHSERVGARFAEQNAGARGIILTEATTSKLITERWLQRL